MKRKIFISISIIYTIVGLCLSYYKVGTIIENHPIIGHILRPIVGFMLFLLISSIINWSTYIPIMTGIDSPFHLISPTLGLLTFKFKKIHYQNLDCFYCVQWGDKVYIYKQGVMGMIHLFEITYWGIENLQGKIKSYVDDNCRERIEKERVRIEKNKSKNEFKNWNGCLDLQSTRDKKL